MARKRSERVEPPPLRAAFRSRSVQFSSAPLSPPSSIHPALLCSALLCSALLLAPRSAVCHFRSHPFRLWLAVICFVLSHAFECRPPLSSATATAAGSVGVAALAWLRTTRSGAEWPTRQTLSPTNLLQTVLVWPHPSHSLQWHEAAGRPSRQRNLPRPPTPPQLPPPSLQHGLSLLLLQHPRSRLDPPLRLRPPALPRHLLDRHDSQLAPLRRPRSRHRAACLCRLSFPPTSTPPLASRPADNQRNRPISAMQHHSSNSGSINSPTLLSSSRRNRTNDRSTFQARPQASRTNGPSSTPQRDTTLRLHLRHSKHALLPQQTRPPPSRLPPPRPLRA